MDYNEILAAARTAASEAESMGPDDDRDLFSDTIGSALGHYQALDDWISHGGFLPAAWCADDAEEEQKIKSAPERWIIAQEEPGMRSSTWWAIIDTEEQFVRVRAYGVNMAQTIVDWLNRAEVKMKKAMQD
jgi:hypothetical protein